MKLNKQVIRFYMLLFLPISLSGQHKLYLEILPGTAYAFPSNLTIYQDGYPDITLLAKYEVRSFDNPIYYSIRVGFAKNKRTAFELELNHLKLYLLNNPHEIQHFSISHGYNQLWFNLRKEHSIANIRAGIGPVVAHPENTVREKQLSEAGGLFNNGYYIHGLTSQLALEKRVFLINHFYLNAEAKLNASYTRTIVFDGHAQLWICAVHVLFGLGFTL